jgi:hypothetical protein
MVAGKKNHVVSRSKIRKWDGNQNPVQNENEEGILRWLDL